MTAHEAYWLGHRHGQRVREHQGDGQELALRLTVQLAGTSLPFRTRRAFALGELRGYRQARHD